MPWLDHHASKREREDTKDKRNETTWGSEARVGKWSGRNSSHGWNSRIGSRIRSDVNAKLELDPPSRQGTPGRSNGCPGGTGGQKQDEGTFPCAFFLPLRSISSCRVSFLFFSLRRRTRFPFHDPIVSSMQRHGIFPRLPSTDRKGRNEDRRKAARRWKDTMRSKRMDPIQKRKERDENVSKKKR